MHPQSLRCLKKRSFQPVLNHLKKLRTLISFDITPPLNIKNKKKSETRAKAVKIQRVEEKHITKFQINDVERDGAFVINYTDNGKAQKKKFRYKSCGKDSCHGQGN